MTVPQGAPAPPPPFPRPPAASWRTPQPKAPRATAAMVLGIVSVAGFFLLVVPVFLAPVAWYLGAHARREIEREPTRWSGGGEARAGLVLGMVGTGLIVVLFAVLGLILGGLVLVSGYDAGYGS